MLVCSGLVAQARLRLDSFRNRQPSRWVHSGRHAAVRGTYYASYCNWRDWPKPRFFLEGVCIRKSDLAERRFDRCWTMSQCT